MKLFISYQKKIFTSPLIYISIIGIALLSYMGMPKIDLEFGVIHAFDIMIELSVYNKIMMIFVSIPFTATFCNEYNYRVTNSILIRTTENKYLMTHIVMTFILSVITAFLGIMLCIATMSLSILSLFMTCPLMGGQLNLYALMGMSIFTCLLKYCFAL